MKKIVTLTVLCFFVLTARSQDTNTTKMDPIAQAAESWGRFLKQNVQLGAKEDKIQILMKGKFREYAVVHHGGTGAYDVIFKIDDFHEVTFSFDSQSKLQLLPVFQSTKPWIRFPDGSIIEKEA